MLTGEIMTELLLSFFRSAIPLLSTHVPTANDADYFEDATDAGTMSFPPCILVTLFEGEPYTLWNIRDLARHAGLKPLTSFRFEASLYPGYRHARTLGVVAGGGGWRGEDRASRTYVLVRPDAEMLQLQRPSRKKRKRGEESSDDED